MIVIGVDVDKASLTAVAVDEVGRPFAEQTAVDGAGLLEWAATLAGEQLWAIEDCRQLTRRLERDLVEAGERLVRVPPKLTAPQRRTGRGAGQV
jgi:transposase